MNPFFLLHRQLWERLAEYNYRYFYGYLYENPRIWHENIYTISSQIKGIVCRELCIEQNIPVPINYCFLCQWVLQQPGGEINLPIHYISWSVNCDLCPGSWGESKMFCGDGYYKQWLKECDLNAKKELALIIANNIAET